MTIRSTSPSRSRSTVSPPSRPASLSYSSNPPAVPPSRASGPSGISVRRRKSATTRAAAWASARAATASWFSMRPAPRSRRGPTSEPPPRASPSTGPTLPPAKRWRPSRATSAPTACSTGSPPSPRPEPCRTPVRLAPPPPSCRRKLRPFTGRPMAPPSAAMVSGPTPARIGPRILRPSQAPRGSRARRPRSEGPPARYR